MSDFLKDFTVGQALAILLLTPVATPLLAQQRGSAGARSEATALAATAAQESGRPVYTPATGVKFKASDNVFLKSALAVDFTYRKATVTLPLYRGQSPRGDGVYYIITEASDFDVARQLGINYSPKMAKAAGTPGAQAVTLSSGVMRFKGNVDFSPDPINVFPIPPRNADASPNNNYSPLWDAHVNMWTPAAVKEGKVKRIRSLDELKRLIEAGLVTSAMINPPGPGNPYIGGLRSTQAIINCPVVAQPDLPPR